MSDLTTLEQSKSADIAAGDSSIVARQISMLAWLVHIRQHEPTSADVEEAYKMATDQEPVQSHQPAA